MTVDPAKLVFLDEAGISSAMSYNYGWAPPGKKPIIERPMRGRNISLLGAIALDGPRALQQIDGSVNGEVFVRFLREELGPHLRTGDIVVMDGPRIHRVAGVRETLAAFGATPLYLPAYSPEFNPIEMTWSWLKAALRKAASRKISTLKKLAHDTWNRITAPLCAAWITHAGYQQCGST